MRRLIDECTLQANTNALQTPDKTDFQSTKARAGGKGESILKRTQNIEPKTIESKLGFRQISGSKEK